MPNWTAFALEKGFDNAEEMLFQYYVIQGMSITQISEHFFCSRSTVHKILREVGIETRRPGGNQMGHSKVRRLSNEKLFTMGPKELANICSVDVSTIYRERERRTTVGLTESERRDAVLEKLRPADPESLRVRVEKLFGIPPPKDEFFDEFNSAADNLEKLFGDSK